MVYTFSMRFPLLQHGRHFYFFTFVVEGRQALLSRLQRGEKRPQLSELGRHIQACWKMLHSIDSHLTALESAIMPDHVHLLLMVNSETEFPFNPLIFARWFQKVTAHPQEDVDIKTWMANAAPRGWNRFDSDLEVALLEQGPMPRGKIPWAKELWVNVSFDSRQLSAIRRYIRMNPVRYFWKNDHPDLFKCCPRLKHPALNPALPWSAIGDITILASPFLFLVRFTRKKTIQALEPEIEAYLERAQQGGVPVCGFISPAERVFEARLKTLPNVRWIKTVPYGLPERYDPSVEDSRWISARQQLILSSFDTTQYPPFKITHVGCLLMNERIEQMVATLRGE